MKQINQRKAERKKEKRKTKINPEASLKKKKLANLIKSKLRKQNHTKLEKNKVRERQTFTKNYFAPIYASKFFKLDEVSDFQRKVLKS